MNSTPPHTLVACIGNIFLGDDGFGVEVARALSVRQLPPEITVVDYGIRGLDLAYALLKPWSTVVLVDTVARGGAPGTLYLLQPNQAPASAGEPGLDPHSMDPVRLLATAHSLGDVSAEIYIVGCEPEDFGDELEGRMGLSEVVERAVPEAVQMIFALLARVYTGAESLLQMQ